MTPSLRLILADDHRLVRDGIRSLLTDVSDMAIIADVASGDELVAVLRQHSTAGVLPDVVVLDVSMPAPQGSIQNGLEAATIIAEEFPTVKILFLSMHEEAEYIINAMKTGAQGYILKNAEKAELVKAIRTVAEGKRYTSSHVAERLLNSFVPPQATISTSAAPALPTLTQREQEILQCVVEGLSTKLIAERLIISPRTVETHRTNIMAKLHAANTAELVRVAVQYGLVRA